MTDTEDEAGVKGRITRRSYDAEEIRREIPFWSDYERLCEAIGESFDDQPDPLNSARIAALEEFDVTPTEVSKTTNVILDGFLEYLVDHVDSTQNVSAIDCSHLAVGDDGSAVSSSDSGLTNEVFRKAVSSTGDNGKNITTQTLIETGEGNGNTFREIGLVSASSGGTFFNHAVVSKEQKTDDISITYEVELQFRVP